MQSNIAKMAVGVVLPGLVILLVALPTVTACAFQEPIKEPSELARLEPIAVAKDSSGETPVLTPGQIARRNMLERCLAIYYTRQVDADTLRPWSIMHGLIGYGDETLIIARGHRYSATEYLCSNGIGDDRRILYTIDGRLQTRMGPGVQGHEAQLLAMLAQADVSLDEPLTVDGLEFSVNDLVELEMKTCRSDSELTFKLLSLSHYLDSDVTWSNRSEEVWSLERLLREELTEKINDGACGGTHRLMATSYALARRRAQQKSIDGTWLKAEKFIAEFQDYAWDFQNRDGSFSTGWFGEKKSSGDVQRKLYTTGHILEWLVFSLPADQLDDPRVARSVDFILNLMLTAPNYDLAVGPRGHALHALRIYQEKVFQKSDFTQLMNNQRLVSNNPQNSGTERPQTSPSISTQNRVGWRRGRGRR